MGYNYNGKMRPAEVLLKMNGEFEQIRRRETPRDYFATVMNPQLETVIAQMEPKEFVHKIKRRAPCQIAQNAI